MKGEINWEGKSILVVEDDQICFSYLDVVLRPTRATVYHAIEGKAAIDVCTTHPEIDIVLMDIRLPGMNGLDATKHITGIRKDLPVIAQTAYATDHDRAEAISAGCWDFIAKPIRANEIIELIKKYLNDQAGNEDGTRSQ